MPMQRLDLRPTAPERAVRPSPSGDGHRARSQAGFSLAEMLIALLVTMMILVGALGVLDVAAKSGRVQTQVAQMQQSMRAAHLEMIQLTRTAGRGGLARGALPAGIAVSVRTNVDADAEIAPGTTDSPKVVENTDVLTIRGVFDSPLYQLNPLSPNLTLNGSPPSDGTVTLINRTPTGIPLDLTPLKEVSDREEAILLVGPLGDYAVVELKPGDSTFVESAGEITEATLEFNITGGEFTDKYATLNPAGVYPPALQNVVFVGILEEHRFYVREGPASPILSRARVFPGTEVPYDDDIDQLAEDISLGVVDLQIALGIDTDNDGDVEATEWLYDASGDDPTDAIWNLVSGATPPLRYIRVSSLTRTERPERGYVADAIAAIEDRTYGEPDLPQSADEVTERAYRRRPFSTVINVRNL